MASEKLDVVIIGGGHAGLSTAYELKKAYPSLKVAVLEGSSSVGSSWSGRYARLHLHTPKGTSYLPDFPWPKGTPKYPSAAEVKAYLQAFVKAKELPVRLRHHVDKITYDSKTKLYTVTGKVWSEELVVDGGPGGYQAPTGKTSAITLTARCVVLATGPETVPHVPKVPGKESFKGTVVHSTQYKNGAPYKGRKVLVVGCGNSGGEIALCLAEHGADVTMLIRKRKNLAIMLPDDGALTTLLQHFDIKKTLRPYAKYLDYVVGLVSLLTAPNMRGWGLPQILPGWFGNPGIFSGTVHLISPFMDLGTCARIKKGEIKVLKGELRGFTSDSVLVAPPEGEEGWGKEQAHEFDGVVLCTGYDVTGSFRGMLPADILTKVVSNGKKLPPSGQETDQPGLFTVGWDDFFGRICLIRQEAKTVAQQVGARLGL